MLKKKAPGDVVFPPLGQKPPPLPRLAPPLVMVITPGYRTYTHQL